MGWGYNLTELDQILFSFIGQNLQPVYQTSRGVGSAVREKKLRGTWTFAQKGTYP